MVSCKTCLFYDERLSELVASHQDSTPEGQKTKEHFCPMFIDGIPDDIWQNDAPCKYRFNMNAEPEPKVVD